MFDNSENNREDTFRRVFFRRVFQEGVFQEVFQEGVSGGYFTKRLLVTLNHLHHFGHWDVLQDSRNTEHNPNWMNTLHQFTLLQH